ncbi:hypothetical protein BGZ99_005751 [Dissophora globulifera]|uniref:Uncharacterized protein n=1 Tax=Dissophora globulifera TaxID=979702 RepID=A0A9P6UTA2_9FUNG|nr:hypothetical protein BGZ99_005751 [Dissophora globulifera]
MKINISNKNTQALCELEERKEDAYLSINTALSVSASHSLHHLASEMTANATPSRDVDELTGMLAQLYTAPTSEECDEIARDMAARVARDGLIHLKTTDMLINLETEAKNKKSGLAREGALIGICALAEVIGRPSEPYLVPMLPMILDLYADKGPVVQDAAARAAVAIMAIMPSQSAPLVLPVLFQCISGPGKKWQTKVGALQLLADLSNASPIQVGIALPEIIPVVKDCLSDTKAEVRISSTGTFL